MRSKIAVIGELTENVSVGARADVVHVAPGAEADLAGADVVVLAAGADVRAGAVGAARRAGGAVVVVATPDFAADTAVALAASLLPRPRVFGVATEDVAAAVEAVLFGRGEPLDVAVQVGGGVVDVVPARIGAGGVAALS